MPVKRGEMIAFYVVGIGAVALSVTSAEAAAGALRASAESDVRPKCCNNAQCEYDEQGNVISNWNDCFSTPFTERLTVEYQNNGLYVRTPDGLDGGPCKPAAFIKGPNPSIENDASAIYTPNQMYALGSDDGFNQISVGAMVSTDVGNGLRSGANYPHDSNACDYGAPDDEWPQKRFNAPFGIHFDSTPVRGTSDGKERWMGDWFELDMSGDDSNGGAWQENKDNAHCSKWGEDYTKAYWEKNGNKVDSWEDDMLSCWYNNDEMDSQAALSQTQNYMWYGYIDNGQWDANVGTNSFGAPMYWGWNELAMKSEVDTPTNWHGLYLKLPAGAESLQQLSDANIQDAVVQLGNFKETFNNFLGSDQNQLAWAIKIELQDESNNFKTEFGCQNFVFEWDANGEPYTYMHYDESNDCTIVYKGQKL